MRYIYSAILCCKFKHCINTAICLKQVISSVCFLLLEMNAHVQV